MGFFVFTAFLLLLHTRHYSIAFLFSKQTSPRCETSLPAAEPDDNLDKLELGMLENTKLSCEQVLDEFSRRDFLLLSTTAGILTTLCDASPAAAKVVGNLRKASSGSDTTCIPYSSVRKYKSIKLGNGMQVLLVSDRMARQSTAAVSIGGAGQFSNPADLDGLAHLMEHMILSSKNRSRRIGQKSKDFEEWLSDYDGSSNG
jgi:hypothetical protein